MSSKRRLRNKSCTRKIRYSNIIAAKSAAWRARIATSDHIREYRCEFCGGWHIGHSSAGKRYNAMVIIRQNGKGVICMATPKKKTAKKKTVKKPMKPMC